ncbi:MAG: hypothetical protein A2284_03430 [Deltaproteobacteria bacterium RIFOXYA12_FULL_61_11]|nr:MAG: hypothetical protein A2284_03430 [Deltaproteobacteria bacterium RIFOXYA12_FULL_61_11]
MSLRTTLVFLLLLPCLLFAKVRQQNLAPTLEEFRIELASFEQSEERYDHTLLPANAIHLPESAGKTSITAPQLRALGGRTMERNTVLKPGQLLSESSRNPHHIMRPWDPEKALHASYSSYFAHWRTKPTRTILFVPMADLYPSQVRFSFKNIAKILDYIKNPDSNRFGVTFREFASTNGFMDFGYWEFQYCGGKSLHPEEETEQVVIGPGNRLHLLDGHHGMLVSLYLGAQYRPVRIVEDLSRLDEEDFWNEMERRGWALLEGLDGTRRIPNRWDELEDDVFRYFATKLGGVLEHTKPTQPASPARYHGPALPVWVKVDDGIPFIEFYVGDVLRRQGLLTAGTDLDQVLENPAKVAAMQHALQQDLETVLDEDRPANKLSTPVVIPERPMGISEVLETYFPDLELTR